MWLVLLIACKPLSRTDVPDDTTETAPTGDTAVDTTTPPTGDTGTIDTEPFDFSLDPVEPVNNGRFATSKVCAECHQATDQSTAMRDPGGRPVGAYDGWQATMMANSSRDPLWRAVVSVEVAATPSQKDVIESTCMKCHAPMRRADTQLTGDGVPLMDDLRGDAGTDAQHLALDGVSCTMCHQIEEEGLGTEESFSGGYVVNGSGTIYGPYVDPVGTSMADATGFTPVYGQQIADSLVCATCHTVQTRALADDGNLNGGEVLEQAPYLEWENSRYPSADGACVACHMPDTDEDVRQINTVIATQADGTDDPSLFPRGDYRRHVLVGGNTLVPQILKNNAATMGVTASPEAFDAIVDIARENLQDAAGLSLSQANVVGDTLEFSVVVEPQTGHKFPTGIPLRRAWLRVEVSDASGATVWTSGGYDIAGRITGPDGMPLPSELAGGPQMPHFDVVSSEDEVQIYEAVLGDVAGAPTYLLMRGAGFTKDNRLLPQGWSPLHPNVEHVGPIGVGDDPDWTTPGDEVHYQVDVTGLQRPFTIDVSMHYQTLSARFAEQIFAYDTPEVEAFREMYLRTSRAPEFVGAASTTAL